MCHLLKLVYTGFPLKIEHHSARDNANDKQNHNYQQGDFNLELHLPSLSKAKLDLEFKSGLPGKYSHHYAGNDDKTYQYYSKSGVKLSQMVIWFTAALDKINQA